MIKIKFEFVIALLLVFSVYQIQGICNICQTNGAACVNSTSYHLCFGSTKPYIGQTFTCPVGMVCTDLPTICHQDSTRPVSCDGNASCGKCNNNLKFACTSRTTFAFCFGAPIPSNVTGSCPVGRICDASTQEICIREPQVNSIICDVDAAK